MPCYAAVGLLIGSALVSKNKAVRIGSRAAAVVAVAALGSILMILYLVRTMPTPGDIASALTQHPEAYSFSLGHMGDLGLESFAYLRLPLAIAALAFGVGAFGTWRWPGRGAVFSLAIMMVIFLHAARLAMLTFHPYLSSPALAQSLLASPDG